MPETIPDAATCYELLARMSLIRRFEEEAGRQYQRAKAGGFLHLAPTPAGGGWSLSTMRRRPRAPNGLTEFLIAETLAWAKEHRVTEVSLSRQPDRGIVLLARDVTEIDRQEAEAAKAQRLDGIMRMTHQVSHEVGNMIGIITGSLGLLERETGFSDRQKRHIARIRKAADRGRSLASSIRSSIPALAAVTCRTPPSRYRFATTMSPLPV